MVYKSICVALAGLSVFILRRWLRRNTVYCQSRATLEGKIAIITGGTSGVGRAAAVEFVRRKCHVILACRSKQLGDATAASIKSSANSGRVTVIPLDLSSLHSVRHFVEVLLLHPETFPRVDILVNNAGLFGPPALYTEDGVESHFGVNHLGHFLLTKLLLEKDLFPQGARVITVASSLASKADLKCLDYSELFNTTVANVGARQLYANSKLVNCLFSRELHKRYGVSKSLQSFCVHTDGMVYSGLFRHAIAKWSSFMRPLLHFLAWLLLRSPTDGCQSLLHCSVVPEHELSSGKYYGKCQIESWPTKAVDDESAKAMWDLSDHLCERLS